MSKLKAIEHEVIAFGEQKLENNNVYKIPEEKIDSQISPDEIGIIKRSIHKNVLVISVSFMLLFTAFQSVAVLQSSINRKAGLGVTSLSTIYASLVISCMFVPSIMIETLSAKWTLVVSMLCYSCYVAAQFHPAIYTLIPAAIILGLGAAPMWSANCTYISKLSSIYASLTGSPTDSVIARFFGIFFLFFQCSSIWGNIISSVVLSHGKESNATDSGHFITCGVNFCPLAEEVVVEVSEAIEAAVEGNFETSTNQIYILTGSYLVCSVLGALVVALFLDPLSKYSESKKFEEQEKLTGIQLLVATFKHMTNVEQLLIIPLTFWCGAQIGFFASDFTAGYVACTYGVENIGYVLITFGVCDAVCSVSFGAIVKYTSRIVIFMLGALINIILIILFMRWNPNPESAYILFIMAGLWGASDAVWQTQINALYGSLFENKEEAAFANYRLWESLGYILAYILHTQTCVYTKLWVLLGILITGMAGYLAIEALLWRGKSSVAEATKIKP